MGNVQTSLHAILLSGRIIEHSSANFVFFVGETRFDVRHSAYGGHRSTQSARAIPRGWLRHAVDKERLARINDEKARVERRRRELEEEVSEREMLLSVCVCVTTQVVVLYLRIESVRTRKRGAKWRWRGRVRT